MAAWPICDCCPEGSSPPTPPLLQTPFLSSNASHIIEIEPDLEWSCIEILPPGGCILAFNSFDTLCKKHCQRHRGWVDPRGPGAEWKANKHTDLPGGQEEGALEG